MLSVPPLEIIDLLEDVYDIDGNFVEEKLSESATNKQHEIFERYQKECEEMERRSFRVNLSNRTFNPVDRWAKKKL